MTLPASASAAILSGESVTNVKLIAANTASNEGITFKYDKDRTFDLYVGTSLTGTGRLTAASGSGEAGFVTGEPSGGNGGSGSDTGNSGSGGGSTDSGNSGGSVNSGSGGVDADISGMRLNPQTALVSRARAASLGFLQAGWDLVGDKLDQVVINGGGAVSSFGPCTARR